jgi:imidazolonepropionase-like amidohydrolase
MLKLRPVVNGKRKVAALQIPESPRVLKFACGENPKGNYGSLPVPEVPASRMGINYLFRKAFDRAARDAAALASWQCAASPSGSPPDILETEPLIALLEGKARAYIHCYKTGDMQAVIEVAKDYNWTIASFHHSIEAWKMADTLAEEKIITATFALHGLFKMEGYRMNPSAANLLVEAGAKVAFKSDHPVIFGRELVRQAGMAVHHGLPAEYGIPAVTSVPAEAMGLGSKIGKVAPGFDGDLVIWNTHPLSSRLRARTVIMDGLVTDDNPSLQTFSDPVDPTGTCVTCNTCPSGTIFVLHGISQIETLLNETITNGTIVIQDGLVTCVGSFEECPEPQGASVSIFSGSTVAIPGLIASGVHVGNQEVHQEMDSWDGVTNDVGTNEEFIAADGAAPHLFGGKHTTLALGAGVTTTILTTQSEGVIRGLSSCLQNVGDLFDGDALIGEKVALTISLGNEAKAGGQSSSVTGQIAMLRSKLVSATGIWAEIVNGTFPLVITVNQRDTIAAVLRLHSSVAPNAKFILNGALEAHLLASQIAAKSPKISVMVGPWKPFTFETWHAEEEAFRILYEAGALVGLAPPGQLDPDQVAWYLYNTALLTAQKIPREDALRAATKTVAEIYDLGRWQLSGTIEAGTRANVVVWSGDPLEYRSQILVSVTGTSVSCNPKFI